MTFIVFIIVFGYALVVLGITLESLNYKPQTTVSNSMQSPSGFTVLMNYRNESAHLPAWLASYAALDYTNIPVQLILINDASSDASVELVRIFKNTHPQLEVLLIDRITASASAKKDGITQALTHATYSHIITTDADCVLPQQWLQSYSDFYTKHPTAQFVAAPVQIAAGANWITQLQASEMVALQLTTIGGFALRKPFMCNGANMSFTKKAFNDVYGYTGNESISSGDDIFLLEKIDALDATTCHYLKDTRAIVTTTPQLTWNATVQQRARWAQKGTKTTSMLNKLVSFQVLAANALFILAPVLFMINTMDFKAWVITVAFKILVDVVVLFVGYRFFENRYWWRYVPVHLIMYPLLVLQVAYKSLFTVQWQQRQAQL